MVEPWEIERVELMDLDAALAQRFQVLFFQWTVVRGVSEGVEQRTHGHSLGCFLGQQVEK